ncbi:MAG: GFA family protein [Patescibacteria group bacterium]
MEKVLHVGSCKCGTIKFEVITESVWSGYCHCKDCRKATGAPVSAFVIFRKADVQWKGRQPKEHKPSIKVTRTFCEVCGSPISYEHVEWPGRIDFYTCLFDDAENLAPTEHIWYASKLPWLDIQDALPKHEGGG